MSFNGYPSTQVQGAARPMSAGSNAFDLQLLQGKLLLIEEGENKSGKIKEFLDRLAYRPEELAHMTIDQLPNNVSREFLPQLVLAQLTSKDEHAQKVLKVFYGVPVIFLSGNSDASEAMKWVQMGAMDVLSMQELSATLLAKSMEYAIEKRKHLDEIAASKDLYLRLFDDNPSPMYLCDPDTLKFIKVNKAAMVHYGFDEDDFSQLSLKEIRPLEEQEKLVHLLTHPYTKDLYDFGIWRHRRKDGRELHLRLFSSFVEYDGKPARFFMAINVNESVEAAQKNAALHEMVAKQKAKIDHILNSISEVIYSCDPKNHSITYINNASKEVFGFSAEEIMGMQNFIFKQAVEEDVEMLQERFNELLEKGSATFEYRIRNKNGDIRHVINRAVVDFNLSHEPEQINGVFVDVTDIRKAEIKIKEQYEALKEISWIQSHRVRRPVANIIGILELYKRQNAYSPDPKMIVFLERAIKDLDHTIHEIIDKYDPIEMDEEEDRNAPV